MKVLKFKLISSTGATTNFAELAMYGNHVIGYVKDLRDLESKKIALELDLIQDNLLEKDLKLVIITTSKPASNEMVRSQLGFKSPIYNIEMDDIKQLKLNKDKALLILQDKELKALKMNFDNKGILELGQ